jgi:mannose-1-phosphate guanylyltransferase
MAPDIGVERAVFEKSNNLMIIPIKSDWSDVGEWKSIYQQLTHDKSGISKLNTDTDFLQVNSKNCLVSTSKNKLIGLVDVNNLAVIDTPDGLLICNIAADAVLVSVKLSVKLLKTKNIHKYFLKKP